MAQQFRAFRADFRQHMDLQGAWPKEFAFQTWLRINLNQGLRSGHYSQLRAGHSGRARHMAGFVRFLRCCPPESREYRALDQYLAKKSLHLAESPTDQKVVECVSKQVERTFADAFMEGVRFLLRLFTRIRHPTRQVRPCFTEAEVTNAIRWMFLELAHQISRGDLSAIDAIALAERTIGTTLEDYQQRAIDWWRFQPWIVVLALDAGKPTGMAITLPLQSVAFEKIRSGARMGYHCMTSEMALHSATLFCEGVAVKRLDHEVRARKGYGPVVVAVTCQQAHLSDVPGLATKQPMRILTFAPTPTQHRRIKRFGYKPTGTSLNGTAIPLFERRLWLKGRGRKDAATAGVWRVLQGAIRKSSRAGRYTPKPQISGDESPG